LRGESVLIRIVQWCMLHTYMKYALLGAINLQARNYRPRLQADRKLER